MKYKIIKTKTCNNKCNRNHVLEVGAHLDSLIFADINSAYKALMGYQNRYTYECNNECAAVVVEENNETL